MYKDDWLNPTTKWGSRSYYCLSWNISLMHKLRSSGCPSWDTGRRRNKCRLYALCSVLLYFSWAAVIKLQMFDLTRSACGMCLCVCVCLKLFPLFLSLAVWAVGHPVLLALSALIVSWARCQRGSRRKLLEELERIYYSQTQTQETEKRVVTPELFFFFLGGLGEMSLPTHAVII